MNTRLLAPIFLSMATSTQAAMIQRDFTGNDCSGYFGSGFDACTIFINEAGDRIELSPVISKYNGDLSLSETNDSIFPSIDGSEYSFSDTTEGNVSGTWHYAPNDANDPGTRYWATKAGDGFTLHWMVDDATMLVGGACDVSDYYSLSCLDAAQVVFDANWTTPNDKTLSHITFYDTGIVPPVPVPAAVWLLLSGVAGLMGFARRKA